MSDTLYRKKGRRYIPERTTFGDYEMSIPVGSFVLVHAYTEGGRMYHYEVKPDNASFVAAAQVARKAMVDAMRKASPARPQIGGVTPYTKKQLAIIEEFRAKMAETGAMLPDFWKNISLEEIAQAGIDAVGGVK